MQDAARWLDYRGRLSSLTKSREESITDYVARAQDIGAMLSNIGKPVEEAEVVAHLLQGLPEDYDIWRTIMRRSKEEDLTCKKFLNLMLEAELHLARQGQRVDPSMTESAFFSSASKQQFRAGVAMVAGDSQRKCFYCNEAGHFVKDCPQRAEDEEAAERLRLFEKSQPTAGGMSNNAKRAALAAYVCRG
jgi:hypothetical protein